MNGERNEPSLAYHVVQNLGGRLLRLLWRARIENVGNVPRGGRVIVAVNHRSLLDPPLAAVALYGLRYPRFMAKQELFQYPVLGWFLRTCGAIRLDRRGDVGAVRSALKVLEAEGCVLVFPEGTRSKTGEPGAAKGGVGLLAHQTGAPVVPARVWDTERWWRFSRMRIRFGEPLRFQEEPGNEGYRHFARRVMDAIMELR